MANILKIIRGLVKTLALVISLAFIINGLTGVTTMVNMLNLENISMQTINSDDFNINYDDLHIEIGITINNTGLYDIENVQLSLKCDLKNNISDDWQEIVNVNSSVEGVSIAPSQSKDIDISADIIDFSSTPEEIALLLGITDPFWDFADLLDLNESSFEIRMFLEFTISFAFGQYDLTVNFDLTNDDLEIGF